jgi:hypothetical protein
MNQLSVDDLQKVTHEMLELISNDTGLQWAYRNNRIPVLEELLNRTAPENRPAPRTHRPPPPDTRSRWERPPVEPARRQESSQTGSPEMRESPLAEPVTFATFRGGPQHPEPLDVFRAETQDDMRPTVNYTEDSAHHGPPSEEEAHWPLSAAAEGNLAANGRESPSSQAVMQNAAGYLREQRGRVDSPSPVLGSSASSTPRSVSPAQSIPPRPANPSPRLR